MKFLRLGFLPHELGISDGCEMALEIKGPCLVVERVLVVFFCMFSPVFGVSKVWSMGKGVNMLLEAGLHGSQPCIASHSSSSI